MQNSEPGRSEVVIKFNTANAKQTLSPQQVLHAFYCVLYCFLSVLLKDFKDCRQILFLPKTRVEYAVTHRSSGNALAVDKTKEGKENVWNLFQGFFYFGKLHILSKSD